MKRIFPPIFLYIVVAILLVTLGIFGISRMKEHSEQALPTPTLTPIMPTPTPIRPLSPVATQAAFLQFSSSIASLSAAVSDSALQDQTLAPPVLTLPLGF